jgi:hypothetical protein
MTSELLPRFDSHGVTAEIDGSEGVRFEGAAILRSRPHPLHGTLLPQLGVPDAALGFRPDPGARYRIVVSEADGARMTFRSTAVWLERVGSSWWFILERE